MVDGTLIPLASKPGHYSEQFFDRKSNYSLSLTVRHIMTYMFVLLIIIWQLVTLPNLQIIDYVLGPPGSMHDATAFCESRVAKEHD
jgi:hypothetical protein